MTIRNSGSRRTTFRFAPSQYRDRLHQRKRKQDRRTLLEALENRQMLAGPQLTGIQPNEGELLFDGSTLTVAPRELVFRFDDTTSIDPSTLDGIRITRAGADGVFESATATTDFGTGGTAIVEFRSLLPGESGNGQLVRLSSVSRAGTRLPIVSVVNGVINIELNSNPFSTTRIQDLLQSLSSGEASSLVRAVVVSGSSLTPIGGNTAGSRTLTLQGANAAQALSEMGTTDGTLVRFIAAQPGPEGRGVSIRVVKRSFGGPANPVVTVQGKSIQVQINSTPGFTTTVNGFITALNTNPDALSLVTAVLESGSGNASLASLPNNFPALVLAGAGDEVLRPGYVGLGDSAREVVFRFAENLPDDTYRIDILGSGTNALANVAGEAFNNGVNVGIQFELNLGPQVVAVVPEPIRRVGNTLSPAIGVIEVHFNNDDLLQSAAENVNFYQLVFKGSNGTDVVVKPRSVSYSALTNIATLSFGGALSRLADPTSANGEFLQGEFRLRIGTDEGLPAAPVRVDCQCEAGDSFAGAVDLSGALGSVAGGTRSIVLDGTITNADLFPFELPGGPDMPGRRNLRSEDPSRLQGAAPLDYFRNRGADSQPGITQFLYNFQTSYLGEDPSSTGRRTYFNVITEQQKERVREAMTMFSEYLGIQFVESANLGTTIVVGDLFSADRNTTSAQGGTVVSLRYEATDPTVPDLVVLDFQDFDESNDDNFGDETSRGAFLAVGQMIGYGFADDLPQPVTQSSTFVLNPGNDAEATFPSVVDILHGQYMYRPESNDIDLYRFRLDGPSTVSIETFAERAAQVSLLDTALKLYRQLPSGQFEEIAANDDYNSNDSLIRVELAAGTYVIGVSASGNTQYDPTIPGTGFGGRSEGDYQLRLTAKPKATQGLVDTTGVALDGDADGKPGGVFNFWYRPAEPLNPQLRAFELSTPGSSITPATIYVDKAATAVTANGSLQAPFRNIDDAIGAALPGDVVRVLANGGADGLVSTAADNLSYQVGVSALGQELADGRSIQVPGGVTMVVDAGVVIKFRNSFISVGSNSPSLDRSGGALQILGTPLIVEANGQIATNLLQEPIPGSVYLTSFNDSSVGSGNAPTTGVARAGDWGGIEFRGDLDAADESRVNLEANGIFLNQIYGANIRFGGGQVSVAGRDTALSPITIDVTRPTIAYSTLRNNASSALSATPDSFIETSFVEYISAGETGFVPDFDRVGPDIHNNIIRDNTTNGLFIRTTTRTGEGLTPLTGQARFDDIDVVHVLSENLIIKGTPGGPIVENVTPPSLLISGTAVAGGVLAAGDYVYRIAYVDSVGNSSPASEETAVFTVGAGTGSIQLSQLPIVPQSTNFVARRLFRAPVDSLTGVVGQFRLVGNLNGNSTTFTDNGSLTGPVLVEPTLQLRSRQDARLAVDPGVIMKLDGARIETSFGGQFYAEGTQGLPIVMTSLNDSRFGAAGAFRTSSPSDVNELTAGDWAGVYVGYAGTASLDHVRLAGAGGQSRIAGDFAPFNPIEVHQGNLRLANSRLEENADGFSATAGNRAGLGSNSGGSIFVRGAQPTIVDNVIVNGKGAAITVDVNSLSFQGTSDAGRSTGLLNARDIRGNSGPLVRGNRLAGNDYNAMLVRGGQVTTEVVFDDTDIVHAVIGTIEVPNQHIFGGVRLESSSDASLVIKLANNGNIPAGFVVGGTYLTAIDEMADISDRIGGSLQLVGQPDFPVVMTSLLDDSIGAGFTPDGLPQNNTTAVGIVDGLSASTRGTLRLLRPDATSNATFVGNIGLATDALGTEDTGNLQVTIPPGSVIEAAYLHVASRDFFAPFRPNNIGINGDLIPLTWLDNVDDVPLAGIDFETGRGDITEQVREIYANGPGGLIQIPVDETVTGSPLNIEGTAITVIYSNPTLPVRTALILEGGLTAEQFNTILFERPIDTADPNFTAELRLGISFSTGEDQSTGTLQVSEVDVNGRRLTSSAGGFDDGALANGQLITYGGEGDNLALPLDPNDPESPDDELYDLRPLLRDGDSSIRLRTSNPSQDDSIFLSTFLFSGVVGLAEPASPGDWRGITVREGASDRNVVAMPESELTSSFGPGANGVPGSAQFLGELAQQSRGGDENQRLGFIVDGEIATRADLDVYSFVGRAGSEVWFDIDRTEMSLDSVVELIDANGFVLASSDNSAQESINGAVNFISVAMNNQGANPMNKLPLVSQTLSAAQDAYSLNPRDAGLRVILPGETGTRNLYHVRVRSSNNVNGDVVPNGVNSHLVTAGLTQGSYRLQVRLREADEFAGTQVRFGDIRYAETNLQIIGQPFRSPLIGEAQEAATPNDTRANAQPIGPYAIATDRNNPSAANLLASDRLALTVGGSIDSAGDIDWYQFNITSRGLPAGATLNYLSTIFDIDYADGYARADLSLWVFDSNGALILAGLDSNIADDQPRANRAADSTDLSRGSAGVNDPYIGMVELSEGTYFVAVSNHTQAPAVLNQFYARPGTPGVVNNPLIRLEPVTSVRRIVEDHIDFGSVVPGAQTSDIPGTANGPQILFNNQTIVPLTLNDLVIYSLNSTFNGTQTSFNMANPFSGTNYGTVGFIAPDLRDFAVTPNGEFFGYTTLSFTDAGWEYVRISSETGAITSLGPTNLQTFQENFDANGNIVVNPSNTGLRVEALTFANSQFGFFVANRSDPTPANPILGPDYTENLLYIFDAATGEPLSGPLGDRAPFTVNGVTIDPRANGAGTQIRERGFIDTRASSASSTINVGPATTLDSSGIATFTLRDGTSFAFRDSNNTLFRFEFNSGPDFRMRYDAEAGISVRDGDQITINGVVYEFETGGALNVASGPNISEGATLVLTSASGQVATFEMDSNGSVGNGNVPVLFTAAMTAGEAADSLAAAINGAGLGVTADSLGVTGQISLSGESTTAPPTVSGSGITFEGGSGISPSGSVAIVVEENATFEQFVDAIRSAVQTPVSVGVAGDRVNFAGAVSGNDFSQLVARGVIVTNPGNPTGELGNGLVSPGSTGISFLASDSAETIAARIAAAINQAAIGTVTTSAAGRSVTFTNAILNRNEVESVGSPIRLTGVAPGGLITGITMIGSQLFAVSDAGGLFVVNNPNINTTVQGAIGSYVGSATDLLGIQFTGLTTGPNLSYIDSWSNPGVSSVQNMSNLLFGTGAGGRLFAFNRSGVLQPIFQGGATSIATGRPGARGIELSTLDYNLWHVTARRSGDEGHGVPADPFGTREAVSGGSSLYFGFGQGESGYQPAGASGNNYTAANSPLGAPRQDGQPVDNTYNFPGGASGAIESLTFSLEGYAAQDLPFLYFNYFLDTDGFDASNPGPLGNPGGGDPIDDDGNADRDALNVFVITADGQATLVATNNESVGVTDGVLFDNTGSWRQARVPLSAFAGQPDLRLRIEFSTAGQMSNGSAQLRTVAGNRLSDGQTVTLNNRTFELDFGPIITLPGGSRIAEHYATADAGVPGSSPDTRVTVVVEGLTFVLSDGQRTINPGEVEVLLEIVDNPATPVDETKSIRQLTGEEVASLLAAAVAANRPAPTTIQQTFNFSIETNDDIARATRLPRAAGDTIINGNGRLGSADGTSNLNDVDMSRIRLSAGETLTVSVTRTSGLFQPRVRIFDAGGRELQNSVGNGGSVISTFTAAEDGEYYIGINGGGGYDPNIAGSGAVGFGGLYSAVVETRGVFNAVQVANRVQVIGVSTASTNETTLIGVAGQAGVTAGRVRVPVQIDMTAEEVAVALRDAMSDTFAGGVRDAFPTRGGLIELGNVNVVDAGPFAVQGALPTDAFGALGPGRAINNANEGVYLDDFVIGFAERGEMITGAPPNDTFAPNLSAEGSVTGLPVTGSYQLEIRDASEYAISGGTFFRTIDTNDRLVDGAVTLVAPPSNQIIDGSTFSISDGARTLVFEFDQVGTTGGVASGRVRVPFDASLTTANSAGLVARAVVDAINQPSVQSLLDVLALLSTGVDSSVPVSTINLFGSAIVSDPAGLFEVRISSGRGDQNRERDDQGVILIENSRFSFASDYGLDINHGATSIVGGQEVDNLVRYPRNLVELNVQGLVPGVVVQSNTLAYNRAGGIRIQGLADTGSAINPVPFDRIINNTIVGGTILPGESASPEVFRGLLFPAGNISFADAVVNYNPNAGGGPAPAIEYQDPTRSLGVPDASTVGIEGQNDDFNFTSLGFGGSLTLQFTNNVLTGDGTGSPDLVIFEVGDIESVGVEVSRDGVVWTSVGIAGGISNLIDIDAYGFTPQDRLAFVRLTDLRQGNRNSLTAGADIDAVGAAFVGTC
jgi:hypothetical protein